MYTKADILELEIPETAISSDSNARLWLPHRRGQKVTCKLWQVLPCNFRFFLNGRIMVGPGRPFWIYLVFLLAGVTASFVIFDTIPFYEVWNDLVIGAILIFLVFAAIYNLLTVVFSDPGYMMPHWCTTIVLKRDIPTYINMLLQVDMYHIAPLSLFPVSDQYSWLTKELSLGEIHEKFGYTSYCRICKIFQLPDTYHCNECHACIDGGDHHCQILGTCVGRRNYRSFYLFTVTTNVALWLGLIMAVTHLIENWVAYGFLYAAARGVTLYLIISTLILPPLGLYVLVMLPIAHTRLIYQGLTLNQEDYCFRRLWELQYMTIPQKLLQFFRNLYARIIKSPPKSQIPYRVLQLHVQMKAIPRTEVVDEHHRRLQFQPAWPKLRLVLRCGQKIFHYYRMTFIHQDIDLFKDLWISIENLKKAQKSIKDGEIMRPIRKESAPPKSGFEFSRNFLLLHNIFRPYPVFPAEYLKVNMKPGNAEGGQPQMV